MIAAILVVFSLALVSCQHHPHSTPSHPHPPDHTFSGDNAEFIQDFEHHAIALKTDSGCYLTRLNQEQMKHVGDAEGLLRIELEILHHVKASHHFVVAENTSELKDTIKTACPKIYAYHQEHH